VIGGTIVRGLGVASFDLALSGHLARQLAAMTGRGADVEVRGVDRYDIHRAIEVLRDENLDRFDVVLVMMGTSEIISLRPMTAFRRDIRMLLDAIAETAPPGVPVQIAGVAPFMHDMRVPRFAVTWMERRIIRQNQETRRACDESGVAEYVPFAPARAGIRSGLDSAAIYESWATALTPYVERALARTQPRPAPPIDEVSRLRALDELGLDPAPDATVDRIVEMARDMLGVDAASINFIDRDRQWSKSSTGLEAGDIPREQAICNTTIQTPGAYVVEDLDADDSLRDSHWTRGEGRVRFYAGYPIEAPGGERVGALCVMDRAPRQFTPEETSMLRDLALRAQAVLWEQRAAG
jgi:hypothetical protein